MRVAVMVFTGRDGRSLCPQSVQRFGLFSCLLALVCITIGCGTRLDPQMYAMSSDVGAAEKTPAEETEEDEADDDVNPPTPKPAIVKRRVVEPTKPKRPAGGGEKTGSETGSSSPNSNARNADFSKWQLEDYLAAQRELDPQFPDAVAQLIEDRPQDAEAAQWLVALIKNDPDSPAEPTEVVLLDDALPNQVAATQEAFTWVDKAEHPVHSGKKSVRRAIEGFQKQNDLHACRFEKLPEAIVIGSRDSIFVHVYIDADNPPEAIMLGYKTNRWHGAVWGAEGKIDVGSIRKSLGDLPETGRWVRLAIPAKAVELEGQAIQGLAFLQFGGTVYWDMAGVEKYPSDEHVRPVIVALGANGSPPAVKALHEILGGKLSTPLAEADAAKFAWKVIAGNLEKGEKLNEAFGDVLLTAVSEPGELRASDVEGFGADDLFKQSLARFKNLATADVRLKLAERLQKAQATDEQLKTLTNFLAKPKPENIPAQLKLYETHAVDRSSMRKFSDSFAQLSSAAVAGALEIKQDKKVAKPEEAIGATKKLWSQEFVNSVRERFIESNDATVEPDAALLALTMPLAENRETLRNFYNKAGRTSGPRQLEQVGAFDRVMIDPGMIPILKGIWHNDPAARRTTRKGDNEEPLHVKWSKSVGGFVTSMNERFYESGDEGMFGGKSPIKIHNGANVTRSFSRTWMGADDEDLGDLAGHGVGTTIIRYLRTEDELDLRLAKRLKGLYSRQINRSVEHKLEDGTTWIEGLARGNGGRIRSIDVMIYIEEPEELEIGGGLERAPGGRDNDAALGPVVGVPGGIQPPRANPNDVEALQMQQLRSEYQRRQFQLQDMERRIHEALARAERADNRRDREELLEDAREYDERRRRYAQKLAEIEQQIRERQLRRAPREVPGGDGRGPGGKGERDRKPATSGKVPVRIDVLVIEIDGST